MEDHPLYADLLARLHRSQGQPDEARRVVSLGIERLGRRHEQQPDDVITRMHLARLHGLQGEFPIAVTLLSEGLVQLQHELQQPAATESGVTATGTGEGEQPPDPATVRQQQFRLLRQELVGALLGWDEHLARSQPQDLVLRLTLMQWALVVDPGSAAVIGRLAQLSAIDGEQAPGRGRP